MHTTLSPPSFSHSFLCKKGTQKECMPQIHFNQPDMNGSTHKTKNAHHIHEAGAYTNYCLHYQSSTARQNNTNAIPAVVFAHLFLILAPILPTRPHMARHVHGFLRANRNLCKAWSGWQQCTQPGTAQKTWPRFCLCNTLVYQCFGSERHRRNEE